MENYIFCAAVREEIFMENLLNKMLNLHLISVFMLEIVMKSLSNISFALIFPILFDGMGKCGG